MNKNLRIKHSQRATLRLVSGGKEESGSASSVFGPLSQGLITSLRTDRDRQLTELLNYLEKEIQDLSTKSSEVLNTYLNDTELPVKHFTSTSETDTTKPVV